MQCILILIVRTFTFMDCVNGWSIKKSNATNESNSWAASQPASQPSKQTHVKNIVSPTNYSKRLGKHGRDNSNYKTTTTTTNCQPCKCAARTYTFILYQTFPFYIIAIIHLFTVVALLDTTIISQRAVITRFAFTFVRLVDVVGRQHKLFSEIPFFVVVSTLITNGFFPFDVWMLLILCMILSLLPCYFEMSYR